MKPWALYNEFDDHAADWLENLIKAGLIAPGIVDRRSVEDLRGDDLRGFRQVHLFAGIGVWSYALRCAGVPDDAAVWTGSPPCQPFSAAGKGGGVDDERHLWPAVLHLVRECRPERFLGEQVASKDGLGWLDIVLADLEAENYAIGTVDTCSAGSGAPHIRQRLRICAYDLRPSAGGMEHGTSDRWLERRPQSSWRSIDGMDHHHHQGLEGLRSGHSAEGGWDGAVRPIAEAGEFGRMADDDGERQLSIVHGRVRGQEEGSGPWDGQSERHGNVDRLEHAVGRQLPQPLGRAKGRDGQRPNCQNFDGNARRPGPTNGFWGDADWLFCRDGKWRPVVASPQQMADGSAASLGPVRASEIQSVEIAVSRWAERYSRNATEAVRELWDVLSQTEIVERTTGGFDSLQEAPFLLAFMRQLTIQGWRFPLGDERTSSEASRIPLRILRYEEQPDYSSRGRGLEEQFYDEFTDPLRSLSQILAYYAEICWYKSSWKNGMSFPLVSGDDFKLGSGSPFEGKSRQGMLKGYGNAIDAEATIDFIRACLDHSVATRSLNLEDLLS